MHFQQSTPGWTQALLAMPDGAVVKAFDGGLLKEAKLVWTAAGRDPQKLITVLRHFDVYTAPAGTFQEALSHWRAMYARWADATFFEQYAPFVDIVSESNEYTAWSTWQSAGETQKALNNVAAAAAVWNLDYRGQHGIGDHCRVALLASPVSNGWPKAVTQIAVDTDNCLDYHAYCYAPNGARAADCWRNHSGLWHFIEQEHGLRPRWLFGESGPYRDAQMGWRHPLCLNGDEARLVSVMEAWWRDVATTAAYREGRIAGPGCWFTSGNVGWEWYQLDAGQLTKLAAACRGLWAPGEGGDMDAIKVAEWARLILAEATGEWWQAWPDGVYPSPGRPLAAPNKVMTFYHADGAPFVPQPITAPVTWTMWVVEKRGNLLNVLDKAGTANDWFVKAQDVTPA